MFFESHTKLVYKYMALKCARVTRDREDLEQELMAGLAVAVMTYHPDRGSFSNHAFWRFRAVRTAWLKAQRKKNKELAFSDFERDELRPEWEAPQQPERLTAFRKYVYEFLTREERESITELAWQRVERRLLTVAEIARRDQLRLKVIDKIRADFGGEAPRAQRQKSKQRT